MYTSEITPAFFKAKPTVISQSSSMSPVQFPALDVRFKEDLEYQMKMGVITPPHLGIPQQPVLTAHQLLWKNISMVPIVPTPTKEPTMMELQNGTKKRPLQSPEQSSAKGLRTKSPLHSGSISDDEMLFGHVIEVSEVNEILERKIDSEIKLLKGTDSNVNNWDEMMDKKIDNEIEKLRETWEETHGVNLVIERKKKGAETPSVSQANKKSDIEEGELLEVIDLSQEPNIKLTHKMGEDLRKDNSSEDKSLMDKICMAVNIAVNPLKDEIKALTKIIKCLVEKEENKNQPQARILLSQQDSQPPSPSGGRTGRGLAGQGRPKTLQQLNFAQIAAKNVPKKVATPQLPKATTLSKQAASTQKVQAKNPAFSLSRRCQGFYPITSKHIDQYKSSYPEIIDQEDRFQKLGKDCVRDFLFKEMEMSETVVADIRIKSVFYPATGIATGILYAEFQSEGEVDLIKQHAKNLRATKGCRAKLISYIPKSLFKRYKAVEEKAFNIRKENREMATRVWINSDFELRKRKKGDKTPWSQIEPEILLDLPEQDPKKPKTPRDYMDTLTPPTPAWNMQQSKSFESLNQFNFLGEEECI